MCHGTEPGDLCRAVKLGEVCVVLSALRAGKPLLQETNAWENIWNLLIAKLAEMMCKRFHMCLSTMSAGGVRAHQAAWELLAVAQVAPG